MASISISPEEELQYLLDMVDAFPPRENSSSLDEIVTGHRMWSILRNGSPEDFRQDLPADRAECEKWVARHENLKRLEKALGSVLAAGGISSPQIDLKRLAEHRSAARPELAKLLRAFIRTMAEVPFVLECQGPIQELDPNAGLLFMAVYESFPETPYLNAPEPQDEVYEAAGSSTPAKATRDPELYREEIDSARDKRIGQLEQERNDLAGEIRELHNRIDRLKKNNQDLDEKVKFLEDNARKNDRSGSHEAHIYSLESKIENQDSLIEKQEEELDRYRKDFDRRNVETNQLRKANDEIQPLKDQIDELQHRFDEASRKANMVDKYAQKLEAMKDIERSYRNLQGQYEELRHDMGDGKETSAVIAGLRQTIEEYRRTLPSIETERHELQGMLNQTQDDMRIMEEQLVTKQDQLMKAEETIVELRSASGMATFDADTTGLAEELEDSERKAALEAMDPEERSQVLDKELRAERAKNVAAQSQLEDRQTLYKQLEERFEEQRQEKVALERQLKALPAEEVPPTPPPKDDDDAAAETHAPGEEPTEEVSQLQIEIAKLKERVKLMETKDPAAKKAADATIMRQELISTRNEIRLMSTAWWSLNTRSQLNSTILQKKTEASQGFLGQARSAVERAARVRGR